MASTRTNMCIDRNTMKHCLHQVKEDYRIIFKDKLGPVELECGNVSSLAARCLMQL